MVKQNEPEIYWKDIKIMNFKLDVVKLKFCDGRL